MNTKYCDKCHVYVDSTLTNCPLCGSYMNQENKEEKKDPKAIKYNYPQINDGKVVKRLIFRIAIYLTLITVIASTLLNWLFDGTVLTWAVHVYVGFIVFWLTIGRLLFTNLDIRKHIVIDCIAIGGLLYYFSFYFNTPVPWALYYAIPGTICVCIVTLLFCMLVNRKNWATYAVPATVLAFLTFVPLIASFCLYGAADLVIYISIVFSFGIVGAFIIFGNKKYFGELKKRFHI